MRLRVLHKWGTFEGGEKVVDKLPLKSVITCKGFNGMTTTIWLFPRPKRVQGTNPSISRLSRNLLSIFICTPVSYNRQYFTGLYIYSTHYTLFTTCSIGHRSPSPIKTIKAGTLTRRSQYGCIISAIVFEFLLRVQCHKHEYEIKSQNSSCVFRGEAEAEKKEAIGEFPNS